MRSSIKVVTKCSKCALLVGGISICTAFEMIEKDKESAVDEVSLLVSELHDVSEAMSGATGVVSMSLDVVMAMHRSLHACIMDQDVLKFIYSKLEINDFDKQRLIRDVSEELVKIVRRLAYLMEFEFEDMHS